MKKLFLLAASALVVLSCNTKSTSPNGEETTAKRELKTQVFSYEKSDNRANVKLSIEMPVGGDEELGEIIYDFILEKLTDDHDCSDDLSVYRNDGQGLVDLFGGWKYDVVNEEWESFNEDLEPEDQVTFLDEANLSIVENNDKYVTCLYETESFNGADGYWAKKGVTFLKSDCSRVTNDFLFKDPKSPELVKVLRDDLIAKYCSGVEADWDEPDVETVESVLDEPFYVTSKGLAYFYRRPLVFFQNVAGVLPWDKVKDLLTDEAKKLF